MAASPLMDTLLGSGQFWNCLSYITHGGSTISDSVHRAIGSICRLGIILGFGLSSIQLAFAAVNAWQNDSSIGRNMVPYLIRMAILGTLLISRVYEAFTIKLLGQMADAIANSINESYKAELLTQVKTIFGNMSASWDQGGSFFLKVLFSSSTINSIIATICLLIATFLMIVMPSIQGALYLFLVLIGPICIAFGMLDYTEQVFKAWLGQLLTVAFLGVVGACIFLSITASGILAQFATASNQSGLDLINTTIYGLIIILLTISAYPIASALFGSQGVFTGMASATAIGGSIAGAAGSARGVVGAAAMGVAVAGGAMKLGGIAGSKVAGFMGKGPGFFSKLEGYGDKTLNGAEKMHQVSKGDYAGGRTKRTPDGGSSTASGAGQNNSGAAKQTPAS